MAANNMNNELPFAIDSLACDRLEPSHPRHHSPELPLTGPAAKSKRRYESAATVVMPRPEQIEMALAAAREAAGDELAQEVAEEPLFAGGALQALEESAPGSREARLPAGGAPLAIGGATQVVSLFSQSPWIPRPGDVPPESRQGRPGSMLHTASTMPQRPGRRVPTVAFTFSADSLVPSRVVPLIGILMILTGLMLVGWNMARALQTDLRPAVEAFVTAPAGSAPHGGGNAPHGPR